MNTIAIPPSVKRKMQTAGNYQEEHWQDIPRNQPSGITNLPGGRENRQGIHRMERLENKRRDKAERKTRKTERNQKERRILGPVQRV